MASKEEIRVFPKTLQLSEPTFVWNLVGAREIGQFQETKSDRTSNSDGDADISRDVESVYVGRELPCHTSRKNTSIRNTFKKQKK